VSDAAHSLDYYGGCDDAEAIDPVEDVAARCEGLGAGGREDERGDRAGGTAGVRGADGGPDLAPRLPVDARSATYVYKLNGVVCGANGASSLREAMEMWAAEDLYDRDVQYGDASVTINGVTYEVEAKR
jgi:hypothetical protein